MKRISLRTLAVPIVLCAGITTALLLANPVDNIWIDADDLDPNTAGELWWNMTVLLVIGPILSGLSVGFTIGRREEKHYRPVMKGGIATVCGVLLGIALWGVLGGVVHGPEHMFASLAFGLMLSVIGAPVGFLTDGLLTKFLVW